jgi:tripartite-type tricarboxylate transporter receptor subunit TctC
MGGGLKGRWRGALCLMMACVVGAGSAGAQERYPAKPVRVLIGFPPGTTGDVIARVMAPRLGEALGQQIVIDNRPGAGSSIAAEAVARAAPDGYTVLLSTIANSINPALYSGLSFDFSKDLPPVILLAEVPALLVAHPGVAAQSVRELAALAKGKPGEIAYASSGTGTVTHLYGELFNLSAGVKLNHIPYKGSSQAITDLLAGRIALLFSPASTVIPHVKATTLRPLGVIGQRRIAVLPAVPTFAEQGVGGFEAGLWFGLNVPAGTPRAVVERLNQETARALALPEVRAQLAGQGIESGPGSSEQFAALIAAETEKWSRVVRSAGVKGE